MNGLNSGSVLGLREMQRGLWSNDIERIEDGAKVLEHNHSMTEKDSADVMAAIEAVKAGGILYADLLISRLAIRVIWP